MYMVLSEKIINEIKKLRAEGNTIDDIVAITKVSKNSVLKYTFNIDKESEESKNVEPSPIIKPISNEKNINTTTPPAIPESPGAISQIHHAIGDLGQKINDVEVKLADITDQGPREIPGPPHLYPSDTEMQRLPLPRVESPPPIQQEDQLTPEKWFRSFLERYKVKPSCIEILVGNCRRFGLPDKTQLQSDLFNMNSGILNSTDIKYLSGNYGFEKYERWDQLANQPQSQTGTISYVVPSSNVSLSQNPGNPGINPQQPIVYQQQAVRQETDLDRVKSVLTMFKEIYGGVPQNQGVTMEQIQAMFNEKELGILRGILANQDQNQNNPSEWTVALDRNKTDYDLSLKKLDADTSKWDKIADVAGSFLDTMAGEIGNKMSGRMLGGQPDNQGVTGGQPQQDTLDIRSPEAQQHRMEAVCPNCNNFGLTLPNGVMSGICPKCGQPLVKDEYGVFHKTTIKAITEAPVVPEDVASEGQPLKNLERPIVTEKTPIEMASQIKQDIANRKVETPPPEENPDFLGYCGNCNHPVFHQNIAKTEKGKVYCKNCV